MFTNSSLKAAKRKTLVVSILAFDMQCFELREKRIRLGIGQSINETDGSRRSYGMHRAAC